jgi:hypothetical protein
VLVVLDALGNMSRPGQSNSLAAYLTLGGGVWMCGGGCATATLFPYKVAGNNTVPPLGVTKFWSTAATPGRPPEIEPGRMVYDQVHWRGQIWATGVSYPYIYKSPRCAQKPAYQYPGGIVPNYDMLPPVMRLKSPVYGDALYPFYPWRNSSDMFSSTSVWNIEVMPGTLPFPQDPQAPWNVITENFSTNPDSADNEPALDTLMAMRGFPFVPPHEDPTDPSRYYENVIMTYYHGLETPPLMFTGFDIWDGNRANLIQVVDFVLQGTWGLTRDTTVVRGPALAARQNSIRPSPATIRRTPGGGPVPTAPRLPGLRPVGRISPMRPNPTPVLRR